MRNLVNITRAASRAVWLLSVLLSAVPALADATGQRRNDALSKLEANDPAGALEIYQELLIDEPESEQLLFGAACARYRQAVQDLGGGNAEEANTLLEQAKSGFADLAASPNRDIRALAAYNRANCIAVAAKAVVPEQPQNRQEYDAGINALRDAVTAYEGVLQEFPQQRDARRNLDHVRYLLKLQLQNPPEEPPPLFSVIMDAETDLPGARVDTESNTAVLVHQGQEGAQQ